MVELIAKTPCDGLLPVEVKGCELSEVAPVQMSLLLPYHGPLKPLSDVLKEKHGMGFPKPGRMTGKAAARLVWFGLDQAMLIGPVPDKTLGRYASVVDQSDSWAVVRLQGELAEAVLARLVPVDMRLIAFKRGQVVRSQLQHLNVAILRVGAQAFEIMAFRSMAKTLVDDLHGAMVGVAARQ